MISTVKWCILTTGYICAIVSLAWLQSPTIHEVGHLPAGICHWKYGKFDLYRVNPPLPRLVGTLPVLLCDFNEDWTNYDSGDLSRDEMRVGIRFLQANPEQFRWLFFVARCACLPFPLLGAYICWRWSTEMWGALAGTCSLILWCANPMLLSHSALLMPDVPAASCGITACYVLSRWADAPGWNRTFLMGAFSGFAILCKSTWLLLLPIVATTLVVELLIRMLRKSDYRAVAVVCSQLVVSMAIAIYTIDSVYGFREVGRPLRDFSFTSRTFAGTVEQGNRFKELWWGGIPVILPADLVLGIDRQKSDFERGLPSYFCGNWSDHGWWYYHPFAFGIKTPLGSLLILLLASTLFWQVNPASRHKALALLMLVASGWLLFCSQSGFSAHLRYTFVIWPAQMILAGICWSDQFDPKLRWWFSRVRVLAFVGLIGTIFGTLVTFPHGMSYCNSLVGGGRNGHRYLLDSDVAWGQDLFHCQKWVHDHPQAKPLFLATVGWAHPTTLGIEFNTPACLETMMDLGNHPPGWYIVDVSHLHGTPWPTAISDGKWGESTQGGAPPLDRFNHMVPVDYIGNSMFVYHIKDVVRY